MQLYTFLWVCLCVNANRDITEPHLIAPHEAAGAPWCHRATLLLLMPTRSFCSETHQSARCLIGSERWESTAICTPAPKSSLWTCHSRHITCSRWVLHLTKGPPNSTGWDNYTHNTPILSARPSPDQQHKARRTFSICEWETIVGRFSPILYYIHTQWPQHTPHTYNNLLLFTAS